MNALDTQVAGSHYKSMAIQPVEFIEKNNLGYCVGNIIKYVCRYKSKNGIEDLNKAKHYIDILIDLENDKNEESESVDIPTNTQDIEQCPEEVGPKKAPPAEDSITDISSMVEDALGSCANPECVGNPDNYKPTATPEK